MATQHRNFDWNEAKAASNKAKHGVTFADAADALASDINAYSEDDPYQDADRVRTIAKGTAGILFIVWIERVENVTRIISARRADRKERAKYLTH